MTRENKKKTGAVSKEAVLKHLRRCGASFCASAAHDKRIDTKLVFSGAFLLAKKEVISGAAQRTSFENVNRKDVLALF